MLIVSMGGGLGNQMYEYAFYAQLKRIFPEKKIQVDTRFAFPVAHNGIEIFDIFNLQASIASKDEVVRLTKGWGLNGEGFNSNTFMQKVRRKLQVSPTTLLVQNDLTRFYPAFLKIDANKSFYYLGVFANYHYFKDIETEIKEMYKFPQIRDEKNLKIKYWIENSNSVSIHIRRGDYISEGVQLTPKNFYYKAIKIIKSKVNDAQFFVFTDDNAYAKKMFSDEDKFIIVEGNSGKNSFRDMQLMSLCKHNITANSTFSFWGAFLNRNENKFVIAPNLPYTGCEFPFVCDDWLVL